MNYPRTTRDGCLCILRARLNIGEKSPIALKMPGTMILTVIAELIWPNQDYSLPNRRVRNNEPAIWKGTVDIAINNGRNTIVLTSTDPARPPA